MTHTLAVDPGKNTGIALGFYDSHTPYRLVKRWQVHGGLDGFHEWWDRAPWWECGIERPDERVVERFVLDPNNEFTADLTPKEVEGYLRAVLPEAEYRAINWQLRTDKSLLTGYPKSAVTPAQKQRVRFDFLKRFDLFEPGTDNDDSNDAITHALVRLKRVRHLPTLRHYWPPRTGLAA